MKQKIAFVINVISLVLISCDTQKQNEQINPDTNCEVKDKASDTTTNTQHDSTRSVDPQTYGQKNSAEINNQPAHEIEYADYGMLERCLWINDYKFIYDENYNVVLKILIENTSGETFKSFKLSFNFCQPQIPLFPCLEEILIKRELEHNSKAEILVSLESLRNKEMIERIPPKIRISSAITNSDKQIIGQYSD